MDSETITANILAAIREIDDSVGGDLSADIRFEADLGIDSGNFIELFLILEETVDGFTLGSARLEPEDFLTPRHLATFVGRRLAEMGRTA